MRHGVYRAINHLCRAETKLAALSAEIAVCRPRTVYDLVAKLEIIASAYSDRKSLWDNDVTAPSAILFALADDLAAFEKARKPARPER